LETEPRDSDNSADRVKSKVSDVPDTDVLFTQIYNELRQIAYVYMKHERPDHTLQPTALINEVYLKLSSQKDAKWKNRTQFLAIASQAIRRILINHAKAQQAGKRGGSWNRITLNGAALRKNSLSKIDLLSLDEAMKELEVMSERQARVVEMRFFGGMTINEIARTLNISPRTVNGDWAIARAWLRGKLSTDER